MSFGERLQALRRSSGLTQEEFAQELKVSRQAVYKWESSRGYPEIEKIIYICNHYGVSMDELFVDEVPAGKSRASSDEASPEAQPLERKSLKRAFGSFLSNLSPTDLRLLGGALSLIFIVLLVLFSISITSKGASEQMVLKLIWLGLLIVFTLGEAVTVGLTSIWFAAGALPALICALLGGPFWLQMTLFIVVTALCLLAFRPIASKYINSKVEPTNADRILGAEAIVIEDIHNIQNKGAVRVGGMIWSARSQEDAPIPAGTLVRIRRIEGVKVYVDQITEEQDRNMTKEEVTCRN